MPLRLSDLVYSIRQLRKTPAFTLVCVLTLALGIGANTAVFSVMNAVLLRSLPVQDPSRVVYLRTSDQPRGTGTIDTAETFSYNVYDTLRRQNKALSSVLAYVPLASGKVAVRLGAQPEEAEGEMVSGQFFSGLGVQLACGRGFTEEDESSHAPIAVLSWNYWTSRLARNPDILGKPLTVNGVTLTIVGVAAQGFEGVESGHSTDFWIPLQDTPALNAYGNPLEDGKTYLHNSTWWCLRLIARLAPGVSRTQAAIQLQPVFQQASYPGSAPQPGEHAPTISTVPAKSFPGYDEQYGKPLRMLMTMVTLVLLIALSNVAMLLIARNAARQREFSLRLALGAARGHLFRQLLTESAILVVSGGALAWLFAEAATRALGNWAQIESTLAPDSTVLLFTLVVLAVAAILFGLAPLRLALSAGAAQALKTSNSTANTDAARSRTSRIVVALQMTLCVVLLVGGGLLIRTLRNLQNTPLGMNTDGLVIFGVKPNTTSLPEGRAFYHNLLDKLHALPAVEDVTVMEERLGSGWSDNSAMKVDGKLPELVHGSRTVRSNVSGPDFFKTLAVPILMGRDFTASDTPTSPRVGIINQTFADRFLPGRNPLGHTFSPEDLDFPVTIIGVVKDHKYRSIDEEPIPMAWFMYDQIPIIGGMTVEMRVKSDNPMAILPAAQKAVAQIDPNQPLTGPITQRAQFETTIARQILFARLAGFFGLLAAILVATGLYGMLAYRVQNRTIEIGVRIAVGAQRGQMVWMVLRDSLILTAIGIIAGIPLSMLVGKALSSVLYGVQPYDVASCAAAALIVVLVATASSAIPARRAASVDPLTALRSE